MKSVQLENSVSFFIQTEKDMYKRSELKIRGMWTRMGDSFQPIERTLD